MALTPAQSTRVIEIIAEQAKQRKIIHDAYANQTLIVKAAQIEINTLEDELRTILAV